MYKWHRSDLWFWKTKKHARIGPPSSGNMTEERVGGEVTHSLVFLYVGNPLDIMKCGQSQSGTRGGGRGAGHNREPRFGLMVSGRKKGEDIRTWNVVISIYATGEGWRTALINGHDVRAIAHLGSERRPIREVLLAPRWAASMGSLGRKLEDRCFFWDSIVFWMHC